MKLTILTVFFVLALPMVAHAQGIVASKNDGLSFLMLAFIQQANAAVPISIHVCGKSIEADGVVDHGFKGACRNAPCTGVEQKWCDTNAVARTCDEGMGYATCVASTNIGNFTCYAYCG
jgi:hypothetical protein